MYIIVDTITAIVLTSYDTYVKTALTNDISKTITTKSNNLYHSLSYQDLQKTQASTFISMTKSYIGAIRNMLDWCIPTSVHLLSTIFVCVQTIISTKSFVLMIVIVAVWVITIKQFIKPTLVKVAAARSKTRKGNEIASRFILWYTDRITDQGNLDAIHKFNESITINSEKQNSVWMRLMVIFEYSNQLILIIVCLWFRSVRLIAVIKEFKRTSKQMLFFMNNYQRMELEFTAYGDFWEKKTFTQPAEKLPIPPILHIHDVHIHTEDKTFQIKSAAAFIIKQGSLILLEGASGSGKSMFLNGLLGKIDGVKFADNSVSGANYIHNITEFYQGIPKKMNTTVMSIRNLFNNSSDDDQIRTCLTMCDVGNWSNMGLDLPINGKPSGGEVARLALATCVFDMITRKTAILILDEPEQNTDTKKAYVVIQNIIKLCEDLRTTLILVTHLENKAVFNCNTIITFDDGALRVKLQG
jgi:ABC-type transport system involved in cytochrome bd biosynthesis fused ATPase/permease subunit